MQTQIIQSEKKIYIPCQHHWVLTKFGCCDKWKCSKCGKIYLNDDPYEQILTPGALSRLARNKRKNSAPLWQGLGPGGGVPSAWSCPYVICESWEGGQATTTFTDGASSTADNLGWVGTIAANLTVTSSGSGFAGAHGLNIVRTNNADGNAQAIKLISSTDTGGIYLKFYIASIDAALEDYEKFYIVGIGNGDNDVMDIYLYRAGDDTLHIQVKSNGAAINATDFGIISSEISLTTWYTIEARVTRNTANTGIHARVDGANEVVGSSTNFATTQMQIGVNNSENTRNINYIIDNIQFSSTDEYPTGAFS